MGGIVTCRSHTGRTDPDVQTYAGFTEHAYRFAFNFEDKFAPETPALLTILPTGVIENSKVLKPEREKGLIAYAFPQTMNEREALRLVAIPGFPLDGVKYSETPFVFKRESGSYALVQTWPTAFNAKFKSDFTIVEGVNPDTSAFNAEAEDNFRECMKKLFGGAASQQPIQFCHKQTEYHFPVFVGVSEALIKFFKNNPAKMREVAIARIDADGLGFVADGTTGKGEKFEKSFKLSPGQKCVIYKKEGWETMGCVKPYDQFLQEAELKVRHQ